MFEKFGAVEDLNLFRWVIIISSWQGVQVSQQSCFDGMPLGHKAHNSTLDFTWMRFLCPVCMPSSVLAMCCLPAGLLQRHE